MLLLADEILKNTNFLSKNILPGEGGVSSYTKCYIPKIGFLGDLELWWVVDGVFCFGPNIFPQT